MCVCGLRNLAAILSYSRAVPASNTAKQRLGALFYPDSALAYQLLESTGERIREGKDKEGESEREP